MLRRYSIILNVAWAACVGAGLFALERYSLTPAEAASAPRTLPTNELTHDGGKPTLMVFLHPRCPCSVATLAELAEVLAGCPDRANVRVFVTRPNGVEPGWERTPLWETAERLPNAAVEPDIASTAAKKFGAKASGQILLYSPAGQLLFSGGITGSRGHVGDNVGRRALIAALSTPPSRLSVSETSIKVFGCALFSADACKRSTASDASAVCQ